MAAASQSQLKRVAATDPRTGLPTAMTSPLAPIAIGPSPTHAGGSKAPGSPAAATSAAGALRTLHLTSRSIVRFCHPYTSVLVQ